MSKKAKVIRRKAKRMTSAEYEKTPEDRREDKKRAKALGLSLYSYEHTAADRAADRKAIRRINRERKAKEKKE